MLLSHLHIVFLFFGLYLVKSAPVGPATVSPTHHQKIGDILITIDLDNTRSNSHNETPTIQPRGLPDLAKYKAHLQNPKTQHKHVFYSGTYKGKSVHDDAEKHAMKTGGTTLNQDLKKAGIVKQPEVNKQTMAWWTDASKMKAQNAKGHVQVVLGDTVSKESVWSKHELPALMSNPNVKSLAQVHPKTGAVVKMLKGNNPQNPKPKL